MKWDFIGMSMNWHTCVDRKKEKKKSYMANSKSKINYSFKLLRTMKVYHLSIYNLWYGRYDVVAQGLESSSESTFIMHGELVPFMLTSPNCSDIWLVRSVYCISSSTIASFALFFFFFFFFKCSIDNETKNFCMKFYNFILINSPNFTRTKVIQPSFNQLEKE